MIFKGTELLNLIRSCQMRQTAGKTLILALLAAFIVLVDAICSKNYPANDTYIPLQNCLSYYQFTMGIGKPVQFSTFLIDTGSHTLWVPSSLCACGNSYNEKQSTTYAAGGRPGSVKVI